MIRILLVEDILAMLESMEIALSVQPDFTVARAITNAAVAPAVCCEIKPDLVLMDVCTEGGASGIEACAEIKRTMPDVRVVLTTAYDDVTFLRRAREAGADSFLPKSLGMRRTFEVLRGTMEGNGWYPEEKKPDFLLPDVELTDREIDVLRLVCYGCTAQEIADELFISRKTAENHIASLREKTGFRSAAKLARFAQEKGYISPERGDIDRR